MVNLTTDQLLCIVLLFIFVLCIIIFIVNNVMLSSSTAKSLENIDNHLVQIYRAISDLNETLDRVGGNIRDGIEEVADANKRVKKDSQG